MADATVAVDTTTPNATQATSNLDVGPWLSNTHTLGWRANNTGSGTAYNTGSFPVYEADGTPTAPGGVFTGAITHMQQASGVVFFNAFSYNSHTGNPWPDPTADCPLSDTTTYPYWSDSGAVANAIPYVDGDGYYLPPAAWSNTDTGNPWATLDVAVMLARTLVTKSKICLVLRAAPSWMGATWQGSSSAAGPANLATPSDPNHFTGNPPLWTDVVASGTAASTKGFAATLQNAVSAGATTGSLTQYGSGQWGTGSRSVAGYLAQIANGDTVTVEPGMANQETVVITTVNTATGAITMPALSLAHAAGALVVKAGGTRIITSFWGGNAATAPQATTGYAPAVGVPWTFHHSFARLARRVAERYPFIRNFLVWGEPGSSNKASVTGTNDTGAWLQTDNVYWFDSGSWTVGTYTVGGRNNMAAYTNLYNLCYDALKTIPGRNYTTTPLNVGGPYHALGAPVAGSPMTLNTADIAALPVFFNNTRGGDIVAFDGLTVQSSSGGALSDPTTGLGRVAGYFGTPAGGPLAAAKAYADAVPAWASKPLWVPETYFDSFLSQLNYALHGGGTNWFTHDAQNMALASIYIQLVLNGVAAVGRWQANGDSSASSFTGYGDTSYGTMYNEESLLTQEYLAAGQIAFDTSIHGVPLPFYTTQRALYDYFGPGTSLVTATVTDGSATTGKTILALANATRVLVVNQYPASKSIDLTLNGAANQTVTMPAYGVMLVSLVPTAAILGQPAFLLIGIDALATLSLGLGYSTIMLGEETAATGGARFVYVGRRPRGPGLVGTW